MFQFQIFLLLVLTYFVALNAFQQGFYILLYLSGSLQIALNSYFLYYEVVQIRIKKGLKSYFSNPINSFDAGRVLLSYLSIGFFFAET